MKNPEIISKSYKSAVKKKGRIEIQPRFKIQYPMKNHNKDAV